MHAAQLPGITRSIEKLANPIAIIAHVASCNVLDRSSKAVAPEKPSDAMRRRLLATSPVQLFKIG